MSVDLRAFVRDIPDFPSAGILFRDITPLLLDPRALDAAIGGLAELVAPMHVDFVVAAEARGFILGAALAREVHADALADGARVLIHDDLLATGGTAGALCDLVADLGAEIAGCAFLVELTSLGGRRRLAPHAVHALIDYES